MQAKYPECDEAPFEGKIEVTQDDERCPET